MAAIRTLTVATQAVLYDGTNIAQITALGEAAQGDYTVTANGSVLTFTPADPNIYNTFTMSPGDYLTATGVDFTGAYSLAPMGAGVLASSYYVLATE